MESPALMAQLERQPRADERASPGEARVALLWLRESLSTETPPEVRDLTTGDDASVIVEALRGQIDERLEVAVAIEAKGLVIVVGCQ